MKKRENYDDREKQRYHKARSEDKTVKITHRKYSKGFFTQSVICDDLAQDKNGKAKFADDYVDLLKLSKQNPNDESIKGRINAMKSVMHKFIDK